VFRWRAASRKGKLVLVVAQNNEFRRCELAYRRETRATSARSETTAPKLYQRTHQSRIGITT
jgi:hypothetical protein